MQGSSRSNTSVTYTSSRFRQWVHLQDAGKVAAQAAALVHEAWYSWHQGLWGTRLSLVAPVEGPLLLHAATRSRLGADVVAGGAATPIMQHQAKALQLQLLVRHMARYVCTVTTAVVTQ